MAGKEFFTGPDSMQTEWVDPDDAPDTSTPEWQAIIDATPVVRGRPAMEAPKISTTIRLDAEVMAHFKQDGRGWQSRINAALKSWIAKRS